MKLIKIKNLIKEVILKLQEQEKLEPNKGIASPSKTISLGACPSAEVNKPPFTIESKVLSSVGVNTPSSSKGINSTSAFSSGV